jgi:hypothetical protein
VAGLLAPALAYAHRGFPVFPCHTAGPTGCSCGRVDCTAPAKHPRTRQGLHDATTNADLIAEWWGRWPWANIGLRTGLPSGIVVLDVDPPAGYTSLARLEGPSGKFPEGWRVATGSGGLHYWFAHPGGHIPNSAGRLGQGLDLRGDGGYVIAPPSRHATGHRYTWNRNPHLPPLPDVLVATTVRVPSPVTPMVVERDLSAWAAAAVRGELDRVRAAQLGARNATLNRAAFVLGQIAGGGAIDPDLIHDLLVDAARTLGLPDTEVHATVTSGLSAGQQRPRRPVDRPAHHVEVEP